MKPFLLAQVSDLHVRARGELSYRVVDTGAMLRACVEHIAKLDPQPDAIAITGDLIEEFQDRVPHRGYWYARWMFYWQVARSLAPPPTGVIVVASPAASITLARFPAPSYS